MYGYVNGSGEITFVGTRIQIQVLAGFLCSCKTPGCSYSLHRFKMYSGCCSLQCPLPLSSWCLSAIMSPAVKGVVLMEVKVLVVPEEAATVFVVSAPSSVDEWIVCVSSSSSCPPSPPPRLVCSPPLSLLSRTVCAVAVHGVSGGSWFSFTARINLAYVTQHFLPAHLRPCPMDICHHS